MMNQLVTGRSIEKVRRESLGFIGLIASVTQPYRHSRKNKDNSECDK
ncbi:MAG: hypothetical protein RIG62_31950 [Cyclobacteriaceae bacterium]